MSIQLQFKAVDGIRVRQQTAVKVERETDGIKHVVTEWKFDQPDLEQDRDKRLVGPDGKHVPTGFFSVYVTTGLKNLVVERKGPTEPIEFRNSSLRNQLRIRPQQWVDLNVGTGKKPHLQWRDYGAAQYVPANTFTGMFVGDTQRVIIDEMPT